MPYIDKINVNGVTYTLHSSETDYYVLGWTDNTVTSGQDWTYLTVTRYGNPSFSYTEYSQYGSLSVSTIEKFCDDLNDGVPIYFQSSDDELCPLTQKPSYDVSYDGEFSLGGLYTDGSGRAFTVNVFIGLNDLSYYLYNTGEFVKGSDTNVAQTDTTQSSSRRVLLSNSASDSYEAERTWKSNKLTFNPNSGVEIVKTGTFNSTSGSGAGYHLIDGTNSTYLANLQAVKQGTASVVGEVKLTLGNASSSTTVGNAKGYIDMYSQNATYYQRIQPDNLTGSRTITVPDVTGELVVHTNATQIGSGITPVYVGASGSVTACSYSLIPYTNVTSW